ncbi:hypothetical protein PAMA_008908 [Pampus argenteus]
MVGSLPESATKHDLRFLARMDKLRRYPNYLKNKGYMPTTIRNMAINIVSLYKHVKNVFLEESRLKVEDIDRVLYELTRLQAEIRRDVVVQQQRVKRQKTNNQLDSEQELSFLYAAKRRIPMLMDAIDKGGYQKDQHSTLMGYLMAYLCVISGHRSVVLTNMTKEHVANADQWNNGTRFQVLGCKLSKPSKFLHLAWSDAGLKGPVSFTLIRSSVATQAERHLSETERRKVARAICHDPTTAERFYVALPTRESAYENRKLRMKALMCEKQKAIGDLQEFKLSGRSGRKAIDNAKQVATHCFRFCYYMVGSLPESATKHDLRFLARMDKLRRYPNYLKNKGYMPTTIRNMAINIVSLYKHVKNVFLEESRLKVEDIDRVLYELTRLQAEIRRDVVVRQQRVKRQKTNNQLDSEQELSFLYAAKRRIPMLMDAIDKGGYQKDQHSTLMGYLMAYLCVISGHRSVVLTNMTKEHEASYSLSSETS